MLSSSFKNCVECLTIKETPKAIEVHFFKNEHEPTGLGEPLFPAVFTAVANALYKATGKRFYNQPFAKDIQVTP